MIVRLLFKVDSHEGLEFVNVFIASVDYVMQQAGYPDSNSWRETTLWGDGLYCSDGRHLILSRGVERQPLEALPSDDFLAVQIRAQSDTLTAGWGTLIQAAQETFDVNLDRREVSRLVEAVSDGIWYGLRQIVKENGNAFYDEQEAIERRREREMKEGKE